MSPGDDARAHLASAEKALKTSWVGLKFSPDHLTASMEFSQAATKFRAANLLDDAVKAWLRAAETKETLRDIFGAARAYESAGGICDGQGPGGPEVAVEHWRKAISCFRMVGKAEIAAKLILKVADSSEKRGDMDAAKAAYEEAIEVFQDDEKDYNLGDVYKQFIGFLVRTGRLEDAHKALDGNVKLLAKQKHHSFAHKELLSKVVLYLSVPDLVRAEQALNPSIEVEGWYPSKECQVGSELVTAFQEHDSETVERVLKEQVFASLLNVEIARAAKSLRIPSFGGAPKAAAAAGASVRGGAAAGPAAVAGGPPATADDLAELLM